MIRRFLGSLVAAAFFAALPAVAQSGETSGHSVIEKMLARNPSLHSYQARVHVNVRMLNFPYLSPKLDGTSYFKRPDNYEVVFDRVPGYAKGFQRLFADIGDPASWERDQDVALDGTRVVDGTPMIALRLTKKIHSDQLQEAIVYVDPATYQVAQMEWHYRNGGAIVMTQKFQTAGPYRVIASQHADIRIPHVHAVADASYAGYQTNVAVADSVFASK